MVTDLNVRNQKWFITVMFRQSLNALIISLAVVAAVCSAERPA